MNVYIVLERCGAVVNDVAVFSSHELASQHVNDAGMGDDQFVRQFSVPEGLKSVYTASTYDAPADLHSFVGVFSTFEEAKNAAGKRGLALEREIIGLAR